MRLTGIIFLIVAVFTSCVKKPSSSPIPVIEFKDLLSAKKTFQGRDTAVMQLGYSDGDGDLFADNSAGSNNLIFTTYYYDDATGTFKASFSSLINDTLRYSTTVRQPANGYYKGKSISGDIFVPLTEFRINDTKKIIMFTGYMVDSKSHKSNVFSSKSFTLNF